MPLEYSDREPPIVEFCFPEDPTVSNSPVLRGTANELSCNGELGIGQNCDIFDKVPWLDEYDEFVFRIDKDGVRTAIRKATDEDYKNLRVPRWIQSDEIPMCCGKEMVFVGQLDDETLCHEPPKDATLWWHDYASFYVFTCKVCMECAAVGQQY